MNRLSRFAPIKLGSALITVSLAFLVLVPGASASESADPVVSISIEMEYNCSDVPDTPLAKGQMARYNLCGYGKGHAHSGDISTETHVVNGPCGSLTLNLFNAGLGIMHWQAIITSTLGPMTSASYSGSWNNMMAGNGFVSRSSGIIFTAVWQSDVPIVTGSGLVTGQINAAVSTIWWGLVCTNTGVPFNAVFVT